MQEAKEQFKKHFEVDDVGQKNMWAVRLTMIKKKQRLKLTQPVLILSLKDEYEIDHRGQVPRHQEPLDKS